MDINAAGGSDAGVPEEKIAALSNFRTSALYTEPERAALELAEAMTGLPVDVPDETFGRLRTHFDDAQLVELAATVATENFLARFSRAFRVEPNNLYCSIHEQGMGPPE